MKPLSMVLAALASLAMAFINSAHAQFDEPKWPQITDFEWSDTNHSKQQRALIAELARARFATPLRGDRSDLDTLQRIANEKLIPADDIVKLQALGIVLGDVFVKELDLEWKVFKDEDGRSRATCIPKTEVCVFPVTMLSRRLQAGVTPDVAALFDSAAEEVEPHQPKSPYKVY
jgi:hypothetical protein